jgi:hypothetical protein
MTDSHLSRNGESSGCAQTPIADLLKQTLEHYERLATMACEWDNQVPQAIRAWYAYKATSTPDEGRSDPAGALVAGTSDNRTGGGAEPACAPITPSVGGAQGASDAHAPYLVSSEVCSDTEIAVARSCGRFFTIESLGYVVRNNTSAVGPRRANGAADAGTSVSGPITSETVDACLDAVLRASGSALRHYTTAKTLDGMRAAMRAAMQTSELAAAKQEATEQRNLAASLLRERDELLSSAPSETGTPSGHEAAKVRIAELVREIEILSDEFGYDPYEWLAGENQGK